MEYKELINTARAANPDLGYNMDTSIESHGLTLTVQFGSIACQWYLATFPFSKAKSIWPVKSSVACM